MIIWLASYPRSGNTLLRIVLNSVFERPSHSRYDDLTDIGASPALSAVVGHRFVGSPWETAHADMAAATDLFFVKTHDPPEDDAKAIYVVRDGRAAVVSYFHYLEDFVDPALRLALADVIAGFTQYGSWGSHLDSWQPLQRANTLLLRYEELVAAPEMQIEKIAAFADIRPTRALENDFAHLQKLSPRFFRRGADVNPATLLAPDEARLFGRYHGDWMHALKYADQPPTAAGDDLPLLRAANARAGALLFQTRLNGAEVARQHAAVQRERERLLAEHDALTQAVRDLEGLRAEHDALTQAVRELEGLRAERDALTQAVRELEGLRAERDALSRDLRAVTETRWWRLATRLHPVYQKLTHGVRVLSAAKSALGRWLGDPSRRPPGGNARGA